MHSYICHLCPIVHDSENVPGPQLFHSSTYDIKKFFANNLFRFIPYCKSFPFSMSMLFLRTLK